MTKTRGAYDDRKWAAAMSALSIARSLVPLVDDREERVARATQLDAIEQELLD